MKYQKKDLGFCTEDTGWPLRTQSNAKHKSLTEFRTIELAINFEQLQFECTDQKMQIKPRTLTFQSQACYCLVENHQIDHDKPTQMAFAHPVTYLSTALNKSWFLQARSKIKYTSHICIKNEQSRLIDYLFEQKKLWCANCTKILCNFL